MAPGMPDSAMTLGDKEGRVRSMWRGLSCKHSILSGRLCGYGSEMFRVGMEDVGSVLRCAMLTDMSCLSRILPLDARVP